MTDGGQTEPKKRQWASVKAKVETYRYFREFFAMLSWNPTPLHGKKLPEAATYGSME